MTKPNLRKGRALRAEPHIAGDEVRELFRAHRIPWSVTAARGGADDSAAVSVFRICTACGPGLRVERYLPKK